MNIQRHWTAYFAGPGNDNENSTLIQSTTLWTSGPCLTMFLPSTFCVEIRAPFYYFLSQWPYHTFWERLGQLWCLESRAQGHPVIRNHGETICYRQLASCFGRVTAVGDIHVSATRNVADPQSRGNHWCEAIAMPCAIENWPSVLAEWQPWETFM